MKIRNGIPTDAELISRCIQMAIGDEICNSFIEKGKQRSDLTRLFAELALDPESQYSYENCLVATTDDGTPVGIALGYDGAELLPRRERFFAKAQELLQMDYTNIPPETEDGEYYIDSFAVLPEYRRQGIGTALLRAAIARAQAIGKPAGLLVEMNNTRAQKVYQSVGFNIVGTRPFVDTEMYHMQCE